MQEYGDNLASEVNERVASLKDVFIREYLSVCGQSSRVIAQNRFRLGVRLYHRVMENVIKKVMIKMINNHDGTVMCQALVGSLQPGFWVNLAVLDTLLVTFTFVLLRRGT